MKNRIIIVLIFLSVNAFAQKEKVMRDSISMKINEQNTIYVEAVFNETDTLVLNFDTGTTELILIYNVLKNKNKIKSATQLYNTPYNLKIGTNNYKVKVYDAELTGHGTDGRFGWDLFKNKIVELNYDKNLMVVHSILPDYVEKNKEFTKLNMEFIEDLLLVVSEIKQSNVVNKNVFLFDTGYQRTAMLDNDLMAQGKFPAEKMEVIKKVIMKGAQGNEIPVITSNLEMLKIGKYKLKNVPVQQTTANKPLKDINVHILGNEVLKRFNTFLDFQKNVVYLKPNHLFNDKYIEGKKKEI
ncbi:retroviral-like aspartic protease family protein [Flavobacterium piscisymbiosum]|uniref:Retroviral-like aspartic protease family protein n=1 Tax=Flavobacterium piscisymbiosum TaxID=2893753 RepID=A0ABS8MLR8_9FLAO|nr:retroviral-like aspartic protease family protein [Flavobacterium sp. F-30]MCC9066417.1 retroviral-like aspartic protease family protein [Flavobacterium sp. F-30]